MKKINLLLISFSLFALSSCGEKQTVTITFDTDGGTRIEPIKINRGSTVTRPSNPYKSDEDRIRYTFSSWQDKKSGGKDFNFSSSINEDITLYAKYNTSDLVYVNYTVGASEVLVGQSQIKVVKDTTYGQISDTPYATREESTFQYWTINDSRISSNYIISNDITLKPYFSYDKKMMESDEFNMYGYQTYRLYYSDDYTKDITNATVQINDDDISLYTEFLRAIGYSETYIEEEIKYENENRYIEFFSWSFVDTKKDIDIKITNLGRTFDVTAHLNPIPNDLIADYSSTTCSDVNDAVDKYDSSLASNKVLTIIKQNGFTSSDVFRASELDGGYNSVAFTIQGQPNVYCYANSPRRKIATINYNDDSYNYKDVKNAISSIRNSTRVIDTSRTLPIDKANVPLSPVVITSSEQLWYFVEHGYRPNFGTDISSSAYKAYQKAKKACLERCDESMTNFEKIRAIYEFVCEKTTYNHRIVLSEAGGGPSDYADWHRFNAYYLEGPLLYGTGVCDSFSKTFALLAGIEQINTRVDDVSNINSFRSSGYSSSGGHAWDYFVAEDNKAYLICPTWGQIDYTDTSEVFNQKISTVSYDAFMASKDFFKNHDSSYSFSDLNFQNKERSDSLYKNNNKMVLQLDTFQCGDNTYDYCLSSSEDYNDNIKKIIDKCKEIDINEDFSFNFVIPSSEYSNQMLQSIVSSLQSELQIKYPGSQFVVPYRANYTGYDYYSFYVFVKI